MSDKTQKSPFVITYQALSRMSLRCFETFGEQAIPSIREAWYGMGLDLGERLKTKRDITDFKSAAEAINALSFKLDDLDGVLLELSDTAYHFRTKSGQPCAVGLGDSGRPICEAVMSVNEGQFKSTCGVDVDMNIIKSRATGADCCEVIFSPR